MAERQTPQLGPSLEAVLKPSEGGVWYDIAGKQQLESPRLGTREVGTDGADYIFVEAGGSIAASTQVAINATTFSATTGGTSGYFTQGTAVVAGDLFWARKPF